jgi:hypothetical protein
MNPLYDPSLPVDCSVSCRLEWLGVSSNFFNVEIYTPALVIGLVVWVAFRTWRKSKRKKNV